jgi:hypothetical protein
MMVLSSCCASNVYFEGVPIDMVDAVVTEEAILTVEKVRGCDPVILMVACPFSSLVAMQRRKSPCSTA